MQNVDYLIIGQGVAGSCLALKLMNESKSFLVIDEDENKASAVAVGVFNPVVLKRFALIWNAAEQIRLMHCYFGDFEKLLDLKLVSEMPTYRIFKKPDEINVWKRKSENADLKDFISDEIFENQFQNINTAYGYAEVRQTGRVDLENCLKGFKEYLIDKEQYINQRFDYSELKIKQDCVIYKNVTANKIVFCEGFGVTKNPFFNYLPVIGVKGEVLRIKTETEIPQAVWKAHNFLMPVDGKICFTASTYDRDDLTPEPTEKGKQEIMMRLDEIYKGKYEILDHTAGIRPTIVDRRPVIGSHPDLKNIFILNGMGTRGTLLAPQMTEYLFDFIENGKDIEKQADVRRFDKLYNLESK